MKTRLTGALLTAVIVAALSGLSATAASAAFTLGPECKGGALLNLCDVNSLSEVKELEGSESFTVTQLGIATLKGTIGGEAVTVTCEETVATGTPLITQTSPLTGQGPVTGSLTFRKCKVTGNATVAKKCKIPVEKESTPLEGLLVTVSELLLKPKTGTEFIIIPFENNGTEVCPATIKGNRAVTGEQAITISEPEVPRKKRRVKRSSKAGSNSPVNQPN